MVYIIQNGAICIRKMEDNITDYKLVERWLSTEEVNNYYGGRDNFFNLESVIAKYSPRIKGEEPVVPCIIELDDRAVGYIQYYCIKNNDYALGNEIDIDDYILPYAMDLFIGETDKWNKGIGTIVVRTLITYLFENENTDILFIDPKTSNKRAVRCYEKSGFKPMKIIKNRELHNGEYKDSLIMSISFEDWKCWQSLLKEGNQLQIRRKQ